MTKEERLKEVLEYRISRAQNEPIDDMDWFIENTIKDVLEALGAVNPLSSNLDKAARKAALVPELVGVDEEHLYEYPYLPIAEQEFKEGAEWMAGQGVSMIITDETEWAEVGKFVRRNCDGESIIQIRKKD